MKMMEVKTNRWIFLFCVVLLVCVGFNLPVAAQDAGYSPVFETIESCPTADLLDLDNRYVSSINTSYKG